MSFCGRAESHSLSSTLVYSKQASDLCLRTGGNSFHGAEIPTGASCEQNTRAVTFSQSCSKCRGIVLLSRAQYNLNETHNATKYLH